jgi:hypothetical protein
MGAFCALYPVSIVRFVTSQRSDQTAPLWHCTVVIVKPKSSMNKPNLLYSQFQFSFIFNMMMLISLESDKQMPCTGNIVKHHKWFHTTTKKLKKTHMIWHTTSIVGFVRMLYVTSSSIHLITNENMCYYQKEHA